MLTSVIATEASDDDGRGLVYSAFSDRLTVLAPLLAVLLAPAALALPALVVVTILSLAFLGLAGAKAGGARKLPAAVRVVIWGSLAMATTFAAGKLFHASV